MSELNEQEVAALNDKAIEALNQGTQAWQEFIEENGKPATLSGAIDGANLENADLSEIGTGPGGTLSINKSNLSGAKLNNVSGDIHISLSKLDGADFSGDESNLSNVLIIRSEGENVNFSEADLGRMRIEQSELPKADFSKTKVSDIDPRLSSIHIAGSNLEGANLKGAQWSAANIEHTNLDNIDASDSDFKNVRMDSSVTAKNSDFSDADMRGVQANYSDFTGANLTNVDASPANSGPNDAFRQRSSFELTKMDGADLKGANFEDANLNHTSFRNADVRGADLTGAETTRAKFDGAQTDGTEFSSPEPRSSNEQMSNEQASSNYTPDNYGSASSFDKTLPGEDIYGSVEIAGMFNACAECAPLPAEQEFAYTPADPANKSTYGLG